MDERTELTEAGNTAAEPRDSNRGSKPPVEAEDKGAVSAYPITREELLVLARHWYASHLESEVFSFLYNCVGSYDLFIRSCAAGRLDLIESLVGDEAIRVVVAKVEAEERERLGEERWRIFTKGSKQERAQIPEAFYQEVNALRAKQADEAAFREAFEFLAYHPTDIFRDAAGNVWYLAEPAGGTEVASKQLVLKVRVRSGCSSYVPQCRLDRPPGWTAPYGLR